MACKRLPVQCIYKRASQTLDKLQGREGSLKSIIFNKKTRDTISFRKRVYALVAETLKHKAVLLEVMQYCNLLVKEPQLTCNMALVLLHDLLIGRGVKCGGPLKYYVTRHREDLQYSLRAIKQGKEDSQSCTLQLPRYVRINTLKTTLTSVITWLEQEGYVHHDCYCEGLEKHFSVDPVLPNVLAFHSSVTLTDHPLYRDSHIILQDKASCLAAFLLAPLPGSKVIDCCAAPGNKTTHLAALMENCGLIHAFDRDPMRFEVLQKRVKEAGATCVSPILSDFLQVNPEHYRDTEYILVDPSCSGSGIIGRLSYHSDESDSKRLAKLSSFQLKILQHALTFPAVKRVVYSTCSVQKEENEMVVHKALLQCGSKYALEQSLPEWTCRGLPIFPGSERCLRAGPTYGTNGFFIAVFIRKDITTDTAVHATPTSTCAKQNVGSNKKTKQVKRLRKRHKLPVTVTATK